MRVKIINEAVRKRFFEEIKFHFENWKKARKSLNLPKSTLEHYIAGRATVPENVFEVFKSYISQEMKLIIDENIEKLPDNWGESKGGMEAYKKNYLYFEEGRKKALKAVRNKRTTPAVFNFDLFPEICEVAGAFVGDGCFNFYKNKLYYIEFSGDKRYDLSYYNDIIIPAIRKVIPNINPHFKESKRRTNSIRIIFYSKDLFYLFKDYFGFIPGKKTFTTRIPEKIENAGNIYFHSAIRGVFDTDGGVFIDRRKRYKLPYPRIFIQTVSKPLYGQLYNYLSKEFKTYTRFNEKRQIYIIEIYGIDQVKKWMFLIGFSNRRHLDRLASVAQW